MRFVLLHLMITKKASRMYVLRKVEKQFCPHPMMVLSELTILNGNLSKFYSKK